MAAARPLPEPGLGRSRSILVVTTMFVCSYTNTTFLTQAERLNDRPRKNDGVGPSPSREETQKRAATKTRDGDSAPRKHAVAARPSTRLAGAARYALFKRRARRPRHTSKRTHNKQPATKK